MMLFKAQGYPWLHDKQWHTALKPELEYDSVQKKIVGAKINMCVDYVEKHRQHDLHEI